MVLSVNVFFSETLISHTYRGVFLTTQDTIQRDRTFTQNPIDIDICCWAVNYNFFKEGYLCIPIIGHWLSVSERKTYITLIYIQVMHLFML